MIDTDDNDLVSSKDIIDKTGISRATLNNYIKMGILPRPQVRRAGPDQGGAKKVGYFPRNVLDCINRVKTLKRQGYPIERIAHEFQATVEPCSLEKNTSFAISPDAASQVTSQVKTSSGILSPGSNSKPILTVTPGDFPAYLVNHDSEVSWANPDAARLFGQDFFSGTESGSRPRNIFNLLLREEFRLLFKNWEEIIARHRKILGNVQRQGDIYEISEPISGDLKPLVQGFGPEGKLVCRIPVDFQGVTGGEEFFMLHVSSFDQGLLFTYNPSSKMDNTVERMQRRRARILKKQLQLPIPAVMSCCVLAVNLNQAAKICAELPPDEYLELYNELWQAAELILERYNGFFGGRTANGVFYYFIKQPDTCYVMNAIGCALELRVMIKNVSRNWQARKNWGNTLLFNIAINEGQEYLGMIWSKYNVELATLGKLVEQAGKLGDFAGSGSILATKNAINGLSAEERTKIRFGVRQMEQQGRVFIENSFARIIDLQEKPLSDEFVAIAHLPVTEIQSVL